MSNTKETGSRRLDSRLRQGGAHTANEADADMSDSPLTSHTTGVGGSVSVKKANQLLIPSLSIKATARKQSEEGEEKRRLPALLLVWNTNGFLSFAPLQTLQTPSGQKIALSSSS